MFENDGSLSLSAILGPIMGRIVYSGVATNDLVQVLRNVEQKPIINAMSLAANWMDEWRRFAEKYIGMAESAERNGCLNTAESLYHLAAVCYRGGSLINSGSLDAKAAIHCDCADTYRRFIDVVDKGIQPVSIPFNSHLLPAYLHLPKGEGPFPAAVMFGGVGGCKEELHGLGRAHTQRGIAVLAVDLPGLGESLLRNHLPWRLDNIFTAIDNAIAWLKTQPQIDAQCLGVYGLCLGGGMAYKYAALKKNANFCTSMFPMLLSQEVIDNSPSWAKMSEWFAFFCGNAPNRVFEDEMMVTDDLAIDCPYQLVHGRYDNWTRLEQAMSLYNRAHAKKDILIVEEGPVYESGHMTTHSVPVVDQYHWVVPVAADGLRALLND
ncbi:MAG: alpha/beta hydrolase [Deltaproteobacteria bacterium]|nr:alpha/beta hydrolase [Deltaproteobacteria bacterium]